MVLYIPAYSRNNNEDGEDNSNGISRGAAVGIAFAALVGIFAIILLFLVSCAASKKKRNPNNVKSVAQQIIDRRNASSAGPQPALIHQPPSSQPYSENPYDVSELPRYEPPEVPEVPPPTYQPPRKD